VADGSKGTHIDEHAMKKGRRGGVERDRLKTALGVKVKTFGSSVVGGGLI